MSDFEPKIPGFHERMPSDIGDHPPYHCYFTETLASAFHQPTLHITGIIHDPEAIPEISAEIQSEGFRGLDDFRRTTFVYGAETDLSVSYDNLVTSYGRSRKESLTGIARPRPLSARELLEREKERDGNSLLEVYIDTAPFLNPHKYHLDAEGAKLIILRGLVGAMVEMPRPMPPAQSSPRWLAAVLSKRERQRRQDPRLSKKEELVGQLIGDYGANDVITLELGANPYAIKPPEELSPEMQEKWRRYYAGEGPKPTNEPDPEE